MNILKKIVIVMSLLLAGLLGIAYYSFLQIDFIGDKDPDFIEKESYANRKEYELVVGDTLDLYYSTNSCCYYSLANHPLKSLKLIDKKIIDSRAAEYAGCDYLAAFVFRAEAVGADTVFLNHLPAGASSGDTSALSNETYIVKIKN